SPPPRPPCAETEPGWPSAPLPDGTARATGHAARPPPAPERRARRRRERPSPPAVRTGPRGAFEPVRRTVPLPCPDRHPGDLPPPSRAWVRRGGPCPPGAFGRAGAVPRPRPARPYPRARRRASPPARRPCGCRAALRKRQCAAAGDPIGDLTACQPAGVLGVHVLDPRLHQRREAGLHVPVLARRLPAAGPLALVDRVPRLLQVGDAVLLRRLRGGLGRDPRESGE